MYSFDKSDFFPLFFFLLRNSVILTVCTLLCVQDIRRFFAPTSAKPAVQKPAPNGNDKQEKKKKNSSSTDEEVKKKKKEANKVRSCPLSLSPFSVPLHPVYPALLWFRVL